jgi:dTDP-glucose pyrophosphorylase
MTDRPVTKAVILARGLGKRMRREDQSAELATDQARVADAGLKAMIPIGRPFLDFVLSALADASLTDVCLVIGPEHGVVREYYGRTMVPTRVRIQFAVQEQPLGTADAVSAAREFAGDDDFLVLNSDNFYPVEAYRALAGMRGPGLIAFDREALTREGNIPPERVLQFAVVLIGADGSLLNIIEKPDAAMLASLGDEIHVSMNCWHFDRRIFDACRSVGRSPRGEFELPDAVRLARDTMGVRFGVVTMSAGVLDLSSRGDISSVKAYLDPSQVRL